MEMVVADLNNMKIWNFVSQDNAQDVLDRANKQRDESIATWKSHIVNYPDGKETFERYLESEEKTVWEIMSYEDYLKAEREKLIGGDLTEIDEDRFNEMLDVLPPLCWTTHRGVEMFCISEMYTGSYTNQYAHDHHTGKYYTKMVDVKDKSTWICELLRKAV